MIGEDTITQEEFSSVSDTKSEENEAIPTVSEDDVTPTDAPDIPETATPVNEETVNYEAIIAEDLSVLRAEFSELKDITDITELNNPIRYAALRDLGLSPIEAYMATAVRVRRDNRSHLTAAYGRNAVSPNGVMTSKELSDARELFGDLSDSEIQRLYRKVTS